MLKAFIALLIFGATQVVATMVALIGLNWENLINEQPMNKDFLLSHPEASGISLLFGAIIAIFLLIATKIARKSAISSLFQRPGKTDIYALIAIPLIAFGMSFLLSPFDLADNGTTELFNMMKGNILCILLLCVFGPLFEEFVFRESILRNLALKSLSPLAAAAVSAILFGAVHGNWAQSIPAIIIGFIFGLFYVRTGNLQLSAGAHILNNSMAVLLMFFPQIEESTASLSLFWSILSGILFCLSGLTFLIIWWKKSALSRIGQVPPAI